MLSRVVAAAFAAAFALGAAVAPVESAARGGAVAIGHGGFHHSGLRHFHRHVGMPRIRHIRPAFAHGRHVFPFGSSGGAALRVHLPRAFHHRHFVGAAGLPITVWGGTAFYGSYYDPSDDEVLYTQSVLDDPPADAAPVAESRAPVGFARRGCRSQDVTVPSASGGERIVTVTRC